MIKFRLPIDGVYNTVTRPIAIGVINDIKEMLYVNPNIRAKLSNQIEDFVTNEQWNPLKLENNSPMDEIIHFSIEEESNEETLITTALNYNEYKPVLYDEDVNAYIRPIYVDTKLNFNIKYRSRSKIDVNNLLTSLRLNIADNAGSTLHNLSYMFYIKPEVMELFLDIATLKDNVFPTDKGFEDYLISNTDGRMTIVGGLDGNTKTMDIGVKETQLDVNGYFQTDIVSVKSEFGSDTGMWEANLTYTVNYNKPSAIYVAYPPLIYNQLLSKKYLIIKDSNKERSTSSSNRTLLTSANEPFMNGSRLEHSRNSVINSSENIINIPNFDTYVHPMPNPHYVNVFSVLIAISKDDKTTLFNLKDLQSYALRKDFLDFIIETEYRYMNDIYNSMFYLELIDDKDSTYNRMLTIDKDLNVSSINELDIRRTYRVVFSIVTDMLMLKPNAVSRILANPIVYNQALNALEIDTNTKGLDRDGLVMMYNKPSKMIRFTRMVNTILALK